MTDIAERDQKVKEDRAALAQAEEKRREERMQKADEYRAAQHEAGLKRLEEEYKAKEERLAEMRKHLDARKKEDERRAALSQAERADEDAKRAAMTPEEKAKDDEAKGLVAPELYDQINQLAATPEYTVQIEQVPHSAGFVLSEANGQLSRENGNFAGAATVYVGQPVAVSAPAVGNVPATYIPVTTGNGATAAGLLLYGAIIAAGTSQYLAVLARNAEVNKNLINWTGLVAADQTAVITALTAKGIIFR